MVHEVFISYADEDKLIADAICAKLEENKIRCWIAPRDILPGQKYVSSLIDAIESSKIVIIVFSHYADKSNNVRNEIERAFNKEKIIIPFRIENIEPSDEIQYFIGTRHWLDALTPPLEEHINKLVIIINNFLSQGKRIDETDIVLKEKSFSDLSMTYTGFWKRLVAFLVDAIIIFGISMGILFFLAMIGPLLTGNDPVKLQSYNASYGVIWFFFTFIDYIFYFAILESSDYQATFGKRVLEILVIDTNGSKISFLLALERTIAKICSEIIIIGVIIIGFTGKNQGLHDKIVKTYVISGIKK